MNRKEDIVLAPPSIPPTHLKCSPANGEYANMRVILAHIQPGTAGETKH